MLVVVLAANLALENFVEPKVMGRTLDIHPLVVLVVTALGGLLGGIVGLILAVPAYVIAGNAIGRLRSRGVFARVADRAQPTVRTAARLMTTNTHPESTVEVPPDDETGARPVATSVVRRRWGGSVFGIVAEGHVRRRPSDIVRVGVAAVVIVLAAAGATDVTKIESAAFDVFASLPGGLEPVWEVLYLLAPIAAVAMLVAALVARRPRLLANEAVAAGVAALVGAGLSASVEVPEALADAGKAVHGHIPDFPVVLMAAGGAVLWASRPYLTRPARRLLETAFWLSALAAAALAEGLPGAVLASLVLAWGAAAVAHLCFGSPAATPSAEQVAASLRDLGVEPAGLRLAQEQTWGQTSYTAGSAAELSIEVVGRDATDARLFAKLWRFIWYKDSGPTLTLTRANQVEHEAYVVLLAGRTGARVPDVVAAGLAGWRDDALLVVRNPAGSTLRDVEPARVTEAVLDDAWTNLARLHDGTHRPRQPLGGQRRDR